MGGLYADAAAGGDVAAGAGLAGGFGAEGTHGISYAGASAGGIHKGVVKTTTYVQPEVEIETQKEVAPALGKTIF